MNFLKITLLGFILAALSGCVATVGALTDKADHALTRLVDAATAKTKADEYEQWSRAENDLLQRITEQSQTAGLTWWYADRKINVRSKESRQSMAVVIAASFRAELPADAVAARHPSVIHAVDALAAHVKNRTKFEPSRLVIVARNQSDAAWLRSAASDALARIGASSTQINTELSNTTAVGWMSEGPVDRTI